MDIIHSMLGARVIFVLGIINLVMVLLLLFSCRCIPSSKSLKKLMQSKAYQRFYKYHCYLWWVFWTSVIIHIVFAVLRDGIPF